MPLLASQLTLTRPPCLAVPKAVVQEVGDHAVEQVRTDHHAHLAIAVDAQPDLHLCRQGLERFRAAAQQLPKLDLAERWAAGRWDARGMPERDVGKTEEMTPPR